MEVNTKYVCYGIILVGLFISMSIGGYSFASGSGNHIGYIADVENYGIFFKPTRVNVISVVPTFAAKDTSYDYGIEPEIKGQIIQFQKDNKKVKIYYETKHFIWRWDYYSNTIIYKIEEIGGEE